MTIVCAVEVFLDGNWVDFTSRVDDAMSDLQSAHGRQTVLTDPEPSTMGLVFRNDDHELTPGNASSSYYPFFDAGAPIRWTEVIASTTVYHFSGKLEMPQVGTFWDEGDDVTNEPPKAHEVVVVSCIDILTGLDRARPFVSTLTEHIRSVGATTLKGLWPLADPVNAYAAINLPDVLVVDPIGSTTPIVAPDPQSSPALPGDELESLDINITDEFGRGGAGLAVTFATPLVLSGTDALTGVIWARRRQDWTSQQPLEMLYLESSTDVVALYGDVGGQWKAGAILAGGAATGDPAGPITEPSTERWAAVGYQMTLSPPLLTLWSDTGVASIAITGSVPSSVTLTKVRLGRGWSGGLAYLQVYLGPPADFTNADFLAQREVALLGHELQTVSDRILMILGYAGVDPADYNVETSPSWMQAASLARTTAGAQLRLAANVDQGLLFSVPDGDLTFQARAHRYYGADTPTDIPYEWIQAPLLWRRDRPFNASEVGQTRGATAYSTDQASIDQYGQGEFSTTLDTGVDADAQALANFITTYYASPRSRIETMTFELDHLTEAQQLLLTTIAIGDRINVTGAPTHWPEGGVAASVEGRQMISSRGVRTLILKCAPIVGETPGTPGPWFTLGTSTLGGPDVVPF